ncbi:MAG: peptidoglycan-associated lipoprotein Pal [Burkholderiales bacterium]|nr:peptidoglycan-associated lipoprotein Pal [Burkholderiales bacterium]
MRKLFAFVAVALLAACAGTPEMESKAGVEDRAATSAAGDRQAGSAVTPVAPNAGQQANPLKDPGSILSKRSIFYDYDKYDVKDEYKPLLQAHARYLAQNPGAKMLVQGNADERGSREYNIALGQKRADGVKKILQLMGVKESQVESVSLGEEKPRCAEATEECYSKNRRSDMLYGGEY